jgi:hypothetical protein
MRPGRTFVVLLAACLGAAGQPVAVNPVAQVAEHGPVADSARSEPALPVDQPPFGLSCGDCSFAPEAACTALWMSPVVAEARDALIRSANRQCYRLSREPGAEATQTCDVLESVTFAKIHYFRPPPPAIPDRFRVLHSTGDVHVDEAGIVLSPGQRYVVFAAPSDGALTVVAACPVDESRELK